MNVKYEKDYIQQINKLCNEINVFTEKHQEMLMIWALRSYPTIF